MLLPGLAPMAECKLDTSPVRELNIGLPVENAMCLVECTHKCIHVRWLHGTMHLNQHLLRANVIEERR